MMWDSRRFDSVGWRDMMILFQVYDLDQAVQIFKPLPFVTKQVVKVVSAIYEQC
jgi:hypothetical protein